MPKIRLAKSRDSRTRRKARSPVLSEEALQLKQEIRDGNAEFMDYLIGKGYSAATVSCYARDAARFERWAEKENVPVEAASYNDILHYIQGKRRQVKQRTLSTVINSLKHYYSFLTLAGVITDNPTSRITIRGIKRKHLYDILAKQELEGLYHNYTGIEENEKYQNQNWYRTSRLTAIRNKVIVGLLVYQGLNTTELQRLKEKDVKLREGKIFIAGTRRSNEREMTLESVQMLDLMEYTLKTRPEILKLTGKESDQLLVSTGTSGRIHNALEKLVKHLKKLNSKVTSLKQIRTSVITHWLKLYNLREVQYMAGHRFVSSTESYLVNDLDDLSEEITRFHPIG